METFAGDISAPDKDALARAEEEAFFRAIEEKSEIDTPREHLNYPEKTMFELVERIALKYPQYPAYEFFNRKTTFEKFLNKIEKAARAFSAHGIGQGDVVTICMPNTPQALVAFYALDRIGAIANMVHPLSAKDEIIFYLNLSGSKMILTMDLFYEKVVTARDQADHPVTILTARMEDELPPHLAIGFALTQGKKVLKFPDKRGDLLWRKFLRSADAKAGEPLPRPAFDRNRTSIILYSGGTTGTPKGICLTDNNINACALQARESMGEAFHPGLTMLSCMPLFHGFGLGINIHTILIHGLCCILMPSFNSKSYAEMLIKKKPNFIAGVPTIFEALLHLPELNGVSLKFLKGMYCGGDSLSVELKREVDTFLKEHGATIQVREGYGLTECVTASCLTSKKDYREGSIGIPFPDTCYAIVRSGTQELLPPGEEGEIILRGPSVMKGYLDNEEETRQTLQVLPDGNTWLYTGDIGRMDEDGFVYFVQREKQMIITNGYNVYPRQMERILDGMEEVAYSCVIGVKDRRRGQRVQAYVVLRDGLEPSEEIREAIQERLTEKVAAYALPKKILFRDSLPRTLVGKVNIRKLEQEAEKEEAELAAAEAEQVNPKTISAEANTTETEPASQEAQQKASA